MFKKYDKKTFDALREQHNIMVLVGNGFDVAILKKYNTGSLMIQILTADRFTL